MYRYLSKKYASSGSKNPFQSSAFKEIKVGQNNYQYYNLNSLGPQISKNKLKIFNFR